MNKDLYASFGTVEWNYAILYLIPGLIATVQLLLVARVYKHKYYDEFSLKTEQERLRSLYSPKASKLQIHSTSIVTMPNVSCFITASLLLMFSLVCIAQVPPSDKHIMDLYSGIKAQETILVSYNYCIL